MRARHFHWWAASLVLIASLWLNSKPDKAPISPVTASADSARVELRSTDSNYSRRIRYPPANYPRLDLPGGGTHLVHSILNITHPLAFSDYVWDAQGIPRGRVWMRIDLARQMLSVFRGGDEIGTSVIIYGAKSNPTPVGIFHILRKSQYYFSKSYGVPMPYALLLTADGVAMHASSVREHSATHGCIGLPADFARLLYNETSRGDEVEILPGSTGF